MARHSEQHLRNHRRLAVVLLTAIALTAAVACTYNFIPGNPLFCNSFCSKCQGCYNEDSEWADDNCEWQVSYGEFEMNDCMQGCGAGDLPGHPMPPTWETWSCGDFDEFL